MYQEDSLTEKLAYHTSNIKLHPKDSNGYYMLAQTLEELGTLNINDNANNYFQQALENYNKAISLYKDLIYMAKLSKLYVKLGEHDLEITSIKEMQKCEHSTGQAPWYLCRPIGRVQAVLAPYPPAPDALYIVLLYAH